MEENETNLPDVQQDKKELITIEKVNDQFLSTYGNPELERRWKNTVATLKETDYLHDIWNRSNSNWMVRNLTLPKYSPVRQMRQIAAELENREMAVSEVKFNLLRKDLEIKEAEFKLENDDTLTDFQRAHLELTIVEKKEQIKFTMKKFNGAMEQIANLKVLYDELVEKHGIPTQEDYEASELYSNLARAITQSIWDVRQCGTITIGNQEYLEQCGVLPSRVLERIIQYFQEAEQTYKMYNTKQLDTFIHQFASFLTDELTKK